MAGSHPTNKALQSFGLLLTLGLALCFSNVQAQEKNKTVFWFYEYTGQFSYSTKVEWVAGSFESIFHSKLLAVQYDYSHMRVKEFANESDYLREEKSRRKYLNNSEKWNQFLNDWYGRRTLFFEPTFEAAMNDGLKNTELKVKNYDPDCELILEVVVTNYLVVEHVSSPPAGTFLDITCNFKTRSGDLIAVMTLKSLHGTDMGVSETGRVVACFKKAGHFLPIVLQKIYDAQAKDE